MLVNRQIIGSCAPMFGLPSVLTEFAKSYAKMLVFSQQWVCGPDQEIHIIEPKHSFHSIARNELAAEALGEWLLMLDADHTFSPDLLFRMINAMNRYRADVVTGLYMHKREPYNPTLWKFLPDGGHTALLDWPKGEVIEVDCAGAGCLLVKTSVFARIRAELKQEPFDTQSFKQTIGEDFAFFRRLHKLGIRTICDTRIECHHLQVKPLKMWEDFDAERLGIPLVKTDIKARKEAAA